MIISMRTTIVLADELFRRTKQRAAELGKSLSEIVAQALQDALEPKAQPTSPFHMVTFGGRNKVHHEPADLHRALEEDDLRHK